MPSAQEILNAQAGGLPIPQNQQPLTYVQSGGGSCGMIPGNPVATRQGVQLDPKNIVNASCGYVEFCLTNASLVTNFQVPFGLGYAGDAAVDYGNLAPFANNVIAVNTPLVTSCDAFYPVALANAAAVQAFNRLIFGGGITVSLVTVTVITGGAAATQFLRTSEINQSSIDPTANFAEENVVTAADPCSPCFTTDSQVINFQVNAVASQQTGFFVPLPLGIVDVPSRVKLRLCISANANNLLFTPCGA